MQSEVIQLVCVGPNSILVRDEDAPVLLALLEQDADSPAYPAGLIEAVRASDPINLLEPRSAAAAEHDRQPPTIAGYLLGLVRDRIELGRLADLREAIALGVLAADIEAAQA